MASTTSEDQILTDEKFHSRTILLNRPRQLNALSNFMNCRLQELYLKWENDNNVNVVVIKGIGRAFCSGGDVATVCLSGNSGEYVGLTGVRLDGAELVTCGLATHFVHSTRLHLLEETISKMETANPNIVGSVIDGFSDKVPVKDGSALHRLDIIDKCFSKETVEDILSALELESKSVADQWLKSSIQLLKKASPISLKITLRSIREGRRQCLHECLIREYRMSCHCLLRKISSDFYEGCRAILVDKDRNPKWDPNKLEHVTKDMVDHYFSPIGEGFEDLQLPIDQRGSTTHFHVHSKL